jgi:hypothetical protein
MHVQAHTSAQRNRCVWPFVVTISPHLPAEDLHAPSLSRFLFKILQSFLITTCLIIVLLWKDAPQCRSVLGSHLCSPPCLESCNPYQSLATLLETPLRGLQWCGGGWRTASRCRGSRLAPCALTSPSAPNLTQNGALSPSIHFSIVTYFLLCAVLCVFMCLLFACELVCAFEILTLCLPG